MHKNPRRWEEFLAWAEFWYNTSYHASTKCSPFEIVYGRLPPTMVSYPAGNSPNGEVDRELFERDLKIREMKEILEASVNRMKEYYDRGRREEEFQVNDWVYLKLRPYRQQSVSQRALYKLGSRFYGPFRVLEKIGEVAYRLELPENAQIHPVIHVSQLKRRLGSNEVADERLPAVNKEGNLTFRPKSAREYRRIKRGGRFRWEVLIEWEELPLTDATWEGVEEMRGRFPDFVLEDKDRLEGNGNDAEESRGLKNAYNRARRAQLKSQAQKDQGPSGQK